MSLGEGLAGNGGGLASTAYVDTVSATSVDVLTSRLLTFGHSYLAGTGATHADRQYITLLSGLLRCDLIDMAVGGAEAGLDESFLGVTSNRGGWAWLLQQLSPYRLSAPYAPNGHLAYLNFGLNDVRFHAADGSGAPRTVWKNAMRTMIARCVASRILEDADASLAYGGSGGTWQTAVLDTTKNSGTQYRPFPGNGATVTFTIPADFEGGSIALGFTGWPASDGQITFTGTASALPATLSLSGQAYATGGATAHRNSSIGLVARATGLLASDAGKTIIATYNGGAGTTLATPSALTVTAVSPGAGGSYQYQLVWLHINGESLPGPSSTAVTNGTTLTSSAYNSIPVPAFPPGVYAARLLRVTATGATGNSGQLGALFTGASSGQFVGGTGTVEVGTGSGLITAPGTIFDQGAGAVAYTNRTLNPLTGGGAFDYAQIEATNPLARVVVCNINRVPDAGYAGVATDADVVNYNADLTSVVAEFGANVLLVDTDTAIAKTASLFAADNLHLNDRGHAVLAQAVAAALNSWVRTIALSDVALHSRVSKRVTSRNLIERQYGTPGCTDYTLTNSWAAVDATNLAPSIDAQASDDIEVVLAGLWGAQGVLALLDIAILDAGGSVIRYVSANPATPTTPGTNGWPSWMAAAALSSLTAIAGTMVFTVRAADLITLNGVNGVLSLRLDGKGNTRVLFAGGGFTSAPLALHVKNLGRRNAPGFNAS